MEGIRIRTWAAEDAEAIGRIVEQAPETERWNPARSSHPATWVAEDAEGLAGFLAARVTADELEILSLAVAPGSRRRGIGGALLAAALDSGRRAGARKAFLEVRESNGGARRFYERHGFAVAGRRRGYYRGPAENAVVMSCGLYDAP